MPLEETREDDTKEESASPRSNFKAVLTHMEPDVR
jgi:hypothetical protein